MSEISPQYRAAGVDIDAGDALIERIKPHAASTMRPEVLTGLGGFASLFRFPAERYRDPVLVSGTDGVGTKLTLALAADRIDDLGRDLVGMCANDVAVTGAEPLFFLDYFATGKLDPDQGERLVAGIAAGCRDAGCALVGGETAELPGLYAGRDFDLAGFCVGVAERDRILTGDTVTPGDVVLGIASSGPHSNGYSLIRHVIGQSNTSLQQPLGEKTLADWLLAPTVIYVRAIQTLLDCADVHALAHITGGGITENLPRVLPEGCGARIDPASWPCPPIFEWLRETGGISEAEMFRVFNMGIGLIAVLPSDAVEPATGALAALDLEAWPIGVIESGKSEVGVRYTTA
ncbi:MAG TPA: phosphoribosylformylglycinamidine cyclo-ligase [Gammaproteobacteria bacterium]|nr:phosphoribosylformylglycinamidine cyclo-ligase [Gammaproteobacteria bacterium]